MRTLFLTRYAQKGATSRLRALQYVPFAEARGWEVTVAPLFSDKYLATLYKSGSRSFRDVTESLARRLWLLCRHGLENFDAVYVQSELVPAAPFSFERFFYAQNPRLVVDYDDATFVDFPQRRGAKDKVQRIMRAAREVIVGNRFLQSYAERVNSRVTLIPTVIDTDRYTPRNSYELGRPAVIGWIGTPITARYLMSIAPALQSLARKTAFTLRCVGCPSFSIPGVRTECVSWSEESEVEAIRSFDVGLMPLIDEPFAHGKSGLKLIQYMGCAVPAVGSAIGANRDIIRDGDNGLLAAGPDEFAAKIAAFLESANLRERLGKAGRITAELHYSLKANAGRFLAVLERAATESA